MTDIPVEERDAKTAGEVTPGRYMRLRREAAGLTIDDVAKLLADTPSGAAGFKVLIEALERNDPMSGSELTLLDQLADARIFRFDPAIYYMLVGRRADPESALPLPGLCRSCGCTWNDACVDDARGPCSWADAEATLCSHCFGHVPANENGHAHPRVSGGHPHAS